MEDSTRGSRKDLGPEWEQKDRYKKLNLLTQPTRANLIQNIVGHCWMMPSKKELDYYNPDKSPGTITGHLEKLTEADIVIRAVIPQGERSRKGPNVFFTLSDEGYALLARHSIILPQLKEIQEDHQRVKKTDEIARCEEAKRPTIDVDYPHPLRGKGIEVVKPEEYVKGEGCYNRAAREHEEDESDQTKRGEIGKEIRKRIAKLN